MSIGSVVSEMKLKCAIMDTGAVRSFVNLDQLLELLKSQIEQAKSSTIHDASRNKLKIVGSINLWVLLGSHLCKERFIVCTELAAPYILGCIYLNQNVTAIFPC